MIAELERLSRQLLAEDPSWTDAESEYWMTAVGAVAGLATPQAYRALIPAIGVSPGIGRRVARLGDEAVPALLDLIDKDFDQGAAVGALGFVWFWADSTGAPLSAGTRSLILGRLLRIFDEDRFVFHTESAEDDGSDDGGGRRLLGLKAALANMGDPAFLPLARALREKGAATIGLGTFVASRLARDVIPMMEGRERALSILELRSRVERAIQLVCTPLPSSGRRRGACEAISNAFATATRHVEQHQHAAGLNALATVRRHVDQARASGAITNGEAVLIGGGAALLERRLQ